MATEKEDLKPLQVGMAVLRTLDELVPRMHAVLEELQDLRDSLGNGAWDWDKLVERKTNGR